MIGASLAAGPLAATRWAAHSEPCSPPLGNKIPGASPPWMRMSQILVFSVFPQLLCFQSLF